MNELFEVERKECCGLVPLWADGKSVEGLEGRLANKGGEGIGGVGREGSSSRDNIPPIWILGFRGWEGRRELEGMRM
jgi:hypothetical protein